MSWFYNEDFTKPDNTFYISLKQFQYSRAISGNELDLFSIISKVTILVLIIIKIEKNNNGNI